MRCIATKFVPRLLINDQKQLRLNMCLEIWEKANEDLTFISRIALFRKLKVNLKGRLSDTVFDIHRESQAILNNIKENNFHSAF
jgi:hypothetical protein